MAKKKAYNVPELPVFNPTAGLAEEYNAKLKGVYRAITDVTIRDRAVTGNILRVVHENEEVYCTGNFTNVGKDKWYVVMQDNTIGFIHSGYLKRV